MSCEVLETLYKNVRIHLYIWKYLSQYIQRYKVTVKDCTLHSYLLHIKAINTISRYTGHTEKNIYVIDVSSIYIYFSKSFVLQID